MTLQLSVSQLSLGARGNDVARVQQALRRLGLAVPASEIESQVLGPGTVAVVKALQGDLGAPVSGAIDAATVRVINARLSSAATERRAVRGAVFDANRNPFTHGHVEIFVRGADGEHNLGKSPIDAADGSYLISYEPPPGLDGRVDLRVTVFGDQGPVETTPSGESVLPNAGPLEVVNFALSGDANAPSSEYDLVAGDVKRILGARNVAELNDDVAHPDISLLASQTGYSTAQIAALVVATRLASDPKTVPLFYGLVREGMPAHGEALLATHPELRLGALRNAVAQGTVPAQIDGRNIEAFLPTLPAESASRLQGLLGPLLPADQLTRFVDIYQQKNSDAKAFWQQIETDPAFASRAADLKLAVQLAALFNNHAPLSAKVRASPDLRITKAEDLARISEDQWRALVRAPDVGAPEGTPGANADEQANNYARRIAAQVEAAFPTPFLTARLGTSTLATFLADHPAFDVTTTYLPQFLKTDAAAAQALIPADGKRLRAVQRLRFLTGSAQETIALADKGLRSAQQIARMDKTVFAKATADILPADRAAALHDQATRTSAMALALYGEHAAALNRTGLQALPNLNVAREADQAAEAIPDWATLFGSFDSCACEQCASAHGPAAYLVDALHFLGERGARDALFARRPDLGDIELSCENVNTPLPLIDLANEVLENAVAPPPPFAPATLAPALEPDLAQTVATPALSAALSPPLHPAARVETLEAGKRWRIFDEAFAYSVEKGATGLDVVARSRQTSGSAGERRATPQYRNSAAYAELGRAVYPWTLPFDLARQEASVFLGHLGVARADLIEALRPLQLPFDANAPVVVQLASERLGLTDIGRKIVVGEALTPPRAPEDFWGGATLAALTNVQALLDRSGLGYAELDALRSTWFINPDADVTIAAQPGAPVDTCDTTRLAISGLNTDVLGRMHRFVRLWRRSGWTIIEVDRVLRALSADPNVPTLGNESLVRLDHLRTLALALRLSVAQALAMWKPIDTAGPDSLYAKLLYNPAVFKPQHEDFRLRPDGNELAHTDVQLSAHAAELQAAFRLNAAGFDLLLAKTDGKLTLGNLSLLYRHATLARQLRLAVADLLAAIELTGLDPFQADRSQDALELVATIKSIQRAGFTVAQLDYLVRHRVNPAAPFVPTDTELTQALEQVRDDVRSVQAASDADRRKLQESAVIDRIATTLGLPADAARELLARVTHGGSTALARMVELATVGGEALDRDNATPQFETLEKLLKVAAIAEALKLSGTAMNWLFRENPWLAVAPDPVAGPIGLASWSSLIELPQLHEALALESPAQDAILGGLDAIAAAPDATARVAARAALVDTLSRWLGWQPGELQLLLGRPGDANDLGLLDAKLPDDYRIALIARLQRTMSLLQGMGVGVAQASPWCDLSVTDADARAIRSAAKARHDDDAWQRVAAPLQNALRDEQRQALVDYLVARPEAWTTNPGVATANELYAAFLIDVEMSSCQLTSRIKQAIGSMQLFAQRCLLGLEPGVQTSDPKWLQWGWMKSYRVWEANRRIWLYPENWIEPELRDDKTPFFKELENELMQSDLDDAAAEQAVRRYLEKLDQVARLEIAGVYEDDEKAVLHVFGRTFHTPRTYYYRRHDRATRIWTAWEKVDLDIEGDHLIPVVWNRKPMLIWPIFAQKAADKAVQMPESGKTLPSADHYWEIQLAWSTFQSDRWAAKNVSEPVRLFAYQGEDDILFGDLVAGPRNTGFLARMNTGGGPGSDPLGDGPGPGEPPSPVPPPPDSSTAPRTLVAPELFSFKALASGETLAVRGYLRLDYHAASDTRGQQIAYPFGEFRFFGCRNIVTAAYNNQTARRNYALAPTGTKFDRMWFAQTQTGLTLFDGSFPVFPLFVQPTVLSTVNEPASIAGDPTQTLVNKLDIPVLDQTPWTFRVLAPHQDLQFVADRPFFFMDGRRAFIGTSTGASGKRSRPNLDWTAGNLATAWRADYFPAPEPPPESGGRAETSPDTALTFLVGGANGARVARRLAPAATQPTFSARTLLPTFWTTREYTFANFYHPYACEFVKTLERKGLAGLLSLETQIASDGQSFAAYHPEARVAQAYPIDEVEFQSGRAYEIYNWELFFHIPLLVADRLRENQRFEEAQRWFHFVFDPTGASGDAIPQRYWRTKPFHDRLSGDYEAESVRAIEALVAGGATDELKAAVEAWRSHPFNPHAVARLRTTAYQKAVVMKYIDNLIAWGDQRFRANTLESINEATQLYVLAAEILGRRPEITDRHLKPRVETFNSLESVGALGNVLEQIELLVGGSATAAEPAPDLPNTPDTPSDKVLYFCVPENDKLLGYWDTVADRLFKIRHCMNIEGQVQQLPLFEPPIDPALLVRAQAAGLSIGEVLSDIAVTLPNYRFTVMLQKASELVAEVRGLGATLLSVLEKRDAEALATLRTGQELRLLQAIRDVRAKQVDETAANVAALQKSRDIAQARKDYYESRETMSTGETASVALLGASALPIEISAQLRVLAGLVQKFGSTKIGSPTTAGIEVGGYFIGVSVEEAAIGLDAAASILNIASQVISKVAEYGRRQDEWTFQAQLATIELGQIDQQLTAAQIRHAVAAQELSNHDQQIDDARDADELMRGKFTNKDLYQWMIGQVSGVYFQSYQLAYDLAQRAERCMQHELGLGYGATSFVRFGYWDSLRKGLLAGDCLAYDLKRLDAAYLDGNIREYELTKHVSLVALAPEQLIALKDTGACEFALPEWLFDLDTPGHYRRRIKLASITIPCVIGPYTSIHCKAQLLKSSYRQSTDLTPHYDRLAADDPGGPDPRFVDDRKILESIVTSTGQNDAGLFEPAFRDERYLPFEGAGAISEWRLELPTQFKAFDYSTISDVILHLRYTARDGGAPLRAEATNSVTARLGDTAGRALFRFFSLRHEAPAEWQRFVSATAASVNAMTVELATTRFPYFAQARTITVVEARAVARTKTGTPAQVAIAPGRMPPDVHAPGWTGEADAGSWTIATPADPSSLLDLFLIFAYTI